MSGLDELRRVNRENFHRIWNAATEGRVLTGEEQRFADAMRSHPEYHNAWEFSDVVGPAAYELEGVNPYLHITAHVMIEAQLEAKDPPEVAQALQRLRGNGVDRHQAIHHIAAELMEVMFPVLKEGMVFDVLRYRKRLRRLGR